MADRLLGALAGIGEPGGRPRLRIPSDFRATPPRTSLRQLLRAMGTPRPDRWVKPAEGQFHNKDWTEECQGVTHDQDSWYVASNKSGRQGVYRLSLAHEKLGFTDLTGNGSGHLGDIDHYQGRIYCAMEQPVRIVVIEAAGSSHWWPADLRGEHGQAPPQSDCPWCAVHPWNGLLYSSDFGNDAPGVSVLRAYRLDEPTRQFRHVPQADIPLAVPVRRVQGGAFSNNGHVLIASDHTDDIRCFSTLNGTYRGRAAIQKDAGSFEEVEGIAIWKDVSYDGRPTQVHVILLDNDWPDGDDVYFKHYQVPTAVTL